MARVLLQLFVVMSLCAAVSAVGLTKHGHKAQQGHLAPQASHGSHGSRDSQARPVPASPSFRAAKSAVRTKGQTLTHQLGSDFCGLHPGDDDAAMQAAQTQALAAVRAAATLANVDDEQLEVVQLVRNPSCTVTLFVPSEPSAAQVVVRLRSLLRRQPAPIWYTELEHSSVDEDLAHRAFSLVLNDPSGCGDEEEEDAAALAAKMAAQLSSEWLPVRQSRLTVGLDKHPKLDAHGRPMYADAEAEAAQNHLEECTATFIVDQKPYLSDTEVRDALVAASKGTAVGQQFSWSDVLKTANSYTGLRMTDEEGVADERNAPPVPWDLLLTGGTNRLGAALTALCSDQTRDLTDETDLAEFLSVIEDQLKTLVKPDEGRASGAPFDSLVNFFKKMYKLCKERTAATTTNAKRVVVVGGGPAGLMAALQAWVKGATSVTLLEKRAHYSRAQKVSLARTADPAGKMWDVSTEAMRKFGFGEQIDPQAMVTAVGGVHIKIQHLERFLTKIALILGITVRTGRQFALMCPPNAGSADWRAVHYPTTPRNEQPSAALQPPVFGGVDPARNIHSLYKLHCVDGDANGRASDDAEMVIDASGTTGTLRESLRVPFNPATTFSLHTLNNKAPAGGGSISAPSLTLLFKPGPGADKCPTWSESASGPSEVVETHLAQLSWAKGVDTRDQCSLSMIFRKPNAAHAALLAQVAAQPDFFNAPPTGQSLDYTVATNPWKLLVDLLRTVLPADISPLNPRARGARYSATAQGIKDLANDLIDVDLNRVVRRVSVFTLELRQAETHAGRLIALNFVTGLNIGVTDNSKKAVDEGIAQRNSNKQLLWAIVGDAGRDAVYRFGIGVNDAAVGVFKLAAALTDILKAADATAELQAITAYQTEAAARVAGLVRRQAACIAYEGLCTGVPTWVNDWEGETSETNHYSSSADAYYFTDATGTAQFTGPSTADPIKTRFGAVLATCFP